MSSDLPTIIAEAQWAERERAHQTRAGEWVEPHLQRQLRGERHPVEDFLFSYYPFRPAHLQRWSPGAGVILAGESARKFLRWKFFSAREGGVWLDPHDFPLSRQSGLHHALSLLRATEQRPAQWGCFGLHEWAMVYREESGRHREVPLRLPPAELAAFVESLPIRCSHYDAFRFFTPAAQPLNRWQPQRETQIEFEQSGCLHANMDLYKWSYKFAPWIPAELMADCFALAREIRTVDMRASPYDLSTQGYTPIRIEMSEGRAEYESAQRRFAAASIPLRRRLIEVFDRLTTVHARA
jgi:hypothetical protein